MKDSFQEEILSMVKSHGAINNDFLARFEQGKASRQEFERFATEFYHFSRHFPLVLCNLLINTAIEEEAAELTKILASELGDGNPKLRHELLYRRFLRSIGIEPEEIMHQPMLGTTRQWIECQMALYGGKEHFAGLGASFGLENMAIPMWDKLIAGLKTYKQKWFPKMNVGYFTFHRQLEEQHEDSMEAALQAHGQNPGIQHEFRRGAELVLKAEQEFWQGLSDKTS